MTAEQLLLFAILGGALILFAWGRWRYDLVALAALLLSVVLGIVPAGDAFLGFGHPAVITVTAVLILSHCLGQSGVISALGRFLRPLRKKASLQIFALSSLTAGSSAFMNNIASMALVLPLALHAASQAKRPPSQVLMPLSFASLLGGLVTLIGTPPNIIVASYRQGADTGSFGMFDFAPVGIVIAVTGVLFVSFIGWRLLPSDRSSKDERPSLFELEHYVAELSVPKDSSMVGKRIGDLEALAQGNVVVAALLRRGDRMLAPSGFLRISAEDILIVETDTATLEQILGDSGLTLVSEADYSAEELRSDRIALVEVVVSPNARMEGQSARSLNLHARYGLNLLGLYRQGERIAQRLGQVRLRAGDVLLIQGEREGMAETFNALGCLPLAERELPQAQRKTNPVPALIFGAAVGLTTFGVLEPHISFMLAVLAMAVLRQLNLREIYDSVEWPMIVLLGALIPVGEALQTTGGTATISAPLLALESEVPVWVLLALLMTVTMFLSDILNNAATAVLMAPIGAAVAIGLGVSMDPFLMAVAVGASSSFLTPIGHQSNLLVMGPGGYRFSDYWRMGLPLEILIVLVSVPTILYVWPL